MKDISIIVAIAQNNAIGKNNDLLWHLPEDLKRFKKLTTGHTIVMGKKTFESLPRRPLPNRRSIVITDIPGEKIDGCEMAYSIEEAIDKCDTENENFIIGGGSVYSQFLPYANKLYITKVFKDFEADIFFPEINYDDWELLSSEDFPPTESNDFAYAYTIYKKIKI